MPFEDIFFVGHGDDFRVGEGIFVEGFELSLETLGGKRGRHGCLLGCWLFGRAGGGGCRKANKRQRKRQAPARPPQKRSTRE